MRLRTRLGSPQLVGTLLLLAATLALARVAEQRRSEPLRQPLDTIGRHLSGWAGFDQTAFDEGRLADLRATSYLSRRYGKPGIQADLFIGFYDQQRAGANMHSPKNCLPGSGWEIWDYGSAAIPVNGRMFTVNRYSISRGAERMLVLYWYQSRGRIVGSEYTAKILLARDALLHASTASSIVRIIVPDREGALAEARGLAAEVIPQMQRCLGG